MKLIFVDTGAWYALVDKNDPEHGKAKKFFKSNSTPLLTTNFVFDETVTLLRMRLGWNTAKNFGQRLKDSNFVSLVSIKSEDEERAWQIFLKYKDKDFSFTDCTTFAVLDRLKLGTIFTFDRHFYTGRFLIVP